MNIATAYAAQTLALAEAEGTDEDWDGEDEETDEDPADEQCYCGEDMADALRNRARHRRCADL